MSFCASCGAVLGQEGLCLAPSCPEKGPAAWVEHYAKILDITLPLATIRELSLAGRLREPSDIYTLELSDLTKLGLDLPTVKLGLRTVENSKSAPVAKVIEALGIAGMTQPAAQALSLAYSDLWALSGADEPDLVRAVGMNELPRQIRYFFERADVTELITNLVGFGVGRTAVAAKPGKSVRGKRICFTGTLQSMIRDEAHRAVRQAGGYVDSSVTRATDILVVVPEDAGATKLNKAAACGTEQWTEDDFLAAVGASPLMRRR